MWHRIRIETNGKAQGSFHGDDPKGGPGPSGCSGLKWSAKKSGDHGRPGDQTPSATASANKPVEVLKPWGPSTAQYWAAYWNNEVLTTVTITTYDSDGTGDTDVPFQVMTLTNARIVGMKQKVTDKAHKAPGVDGRPVHNRLLGVDRIRLSYEHMKVEHPSAQIEARYGVPTRTPDLSGVSNFLRG